MKTSFYLSDKRNADLACELLELSIDELESIVGRFTKQSHRAGQLRGEVVEQMDGSYVVRHHFSKKVLWRSE